MGECRVADDQAILIIAVSVGNGVVLDMLRESDGFHRTDIVSMLREKEVLVRRKELLGILGVHGGDHVEKRVHEERPHDTAKFGLLMISGSHQNKRLTAYLVQIKIVFNPNFKNI